MNCTHCALPLASGPPQTCPRCFTTNSEQEPDPPKAKKSRKRPLRRRVSSAALEPKNETKEDEPESE